MTRGRRSSSRNVFRALSALPLARWVRPALGAVAITLLSSSYAGAQDQSAEKLLCIDKHGEAQVLRRDGKLLKTKEALLVCSREVCPGAVRDDCGGWLGEIEHATPSIVLSARSKNGDEAAVHVTVDGQPLHDRSRRQGRGAHRSNWSAAHVFRFELHLPYEPVEEKAILREGEKVGRSRCFFGPQPEATIAPAPAPLRPVEMRRPVPLSVYVLGGVAVVGTGLFAGFGASGLSRKSSLSTSCAPFCSSSDVSGVRTRFLVGDISLGVAVVAAATAVVTLCRAPFR